MLSLKYILRHRRCCDDRFRVGDVWLVIKLHSEKIVVYWSGAIKPTRLADSTVAKDDAFEDPRPDAVGLRLAGGERRWNDFTARGASEISDLFVLLLAVCTRNIERHSGKTLTPLFTQLYGSWRFGFNVGSNVSYTRSRLEKRELKSVTRWERGGGKFSLCDDFWHLKSFANFHCRRSHLRLHLWHRESRKSLRKTLTFL